MIEIPEALNLSDQLAKTFVGKTIEYVVANHSPHKFAWFFGDPERYGALLNGKTINGSKAVAGHVAMHAEECCILFEGGVTLKFLEANEPEPLKHQLHIRFNDGTALIGSIQMYGGLWAYVDGQNENSYYLVAKEKPSPMTDSFNEVYFNELFAQTKKTLSVKAFLGTDQRIPGLGNGVLQDILFNAQIHPKTKIETLDAQQIRTMFDSIKQTLSEMTLNGGRDVEKDLFGNPGGYKTKLSAKTKGTPCLICNTTILCEAYLGGKIYYCPNCQQQH